ncbi:hypothetical protein [Lysobacter capsici]|uniref:hypothetical protein n=1 Tax=Lysobacter capsici TaxID=435897 RepID=UPI0012FD74D4|nr:hypothetical protein [Lysobacter capsici]
MFRCLAKLYCLEACGWIECWIDEFIAELGDKRIGCQKHRKTLMESVKRTYGFEYEKHLRPLLINISGLKAVCATEAEMDAGVLAKMVASLENLKTWRDKHAHTDSLGTQSLLVAPSACKAELESAMKGLFLLRRTFRKFA